MAKRAPMVGDIYRDTSNGDRYEVVEADYPFVRIMQAGSGAFYVSVDSVRQLLTLEKPALWRFAFGALG